MDWSIQNAKAFIEGYYDGKQKLCSNPEEATKEAYIAGYLQGKGGK